MPGSFPSIRGGLATALFPFTRRLAFNTQCQYYANGTEQRAKRGIPLFSFDWTLNNLPAGDVNTLRTFFTNQGGSASSDWDFTLGGTTWSNLAFTSDQFPIVQGGPAVYAVQLSARQTINGSYTIPTVSAVWPTFSSGAKLQYPFGGAWRNLSTVGSSPTGKQFAYEWWNAGVSGQPTRQLRGFPIQLVLPDADVATFETFFKWAQGKLNTFSFTDPFTGTTYANIRFADDVLELQYKDVNQTGVSVVLVETAV